MDIKNLSDLHNFSSKVRVLDFISKVFHEVESSGPQSDNKLLTGNTGSEIYIIYEMIIKTIANAKTHIVAKDFSYCIVLY